MESHRLFETPVFVLDLSEEVEDLRDRLLSLVLEEARDTPTAEGTHPAGWQSRPDLDTREQPAFAVVCNTLATVARELTRAAAREHAGELPELGISLNAWAAVNPRGGYVVTHDHQGATWSMVFYVDAGDADLQVHSDSGRLVLLDPRRTPSTAGDLELFPSTFEVRPRDGMLVVFPGYLQHYTHPYMGERPRVVIAANATVRAPSQRG